MKMSVPLCIFSAGYVGARLFTPFYHFQHCGRRAITVEIRQGGMSCSKGKVHRLMKEQGLRARRHPGFRSRTSDDRASYPSPNLFKALGADFSHIKCHGCFYYLAVVLDLCSRRVLGWSLHEDIKSGLLMEDFKMDLPSGFVRRAASIVPESSVNY